MTITATQLAVRDPGREVRLAAGNGSERRIRWGQPWQHGTAAYWVAATQAVVEESQAGGHRSHRLGNNLREEVVACILGGWGMPYEIGLAAFQRVRQRHLESGGLLSSAEVEESLREPFPIDGAWRRYRFPKQRAERLVGALDFIATSEIPSSPVQIRDWLVGAPGIGLKTASWIVRNHWGSGDVAVLDVHVLRAGVAGDVFPEEFNIVHNYRELEALFLSWAAEGGVSAADLDSVIWAEQAYWARVGTGKRSGV